MDRRNARPVASRKNDTHPSQTDSPRALRLALLCDAWCADIAPCADLRQLRSASLDSVHAVRRSLGRSLADGFWCRARGGGLADGFLPRPGDGLQLHLCVDLDWVTLDSDVAGPT